MFGKSFSSKIVGLVKKKKNPRTYTKTQFRIVYYTCHIGIYIVYYTSYYYDRVYNNIIYLIYNMYILRCVRIFSCFAKFDVRWLTIGDGGGMRELSEIDGWGLRDEESTVFHVTQHGPHPRSSRHRHRYIIFPAAKHLHHRYHHHRPMYISEFRFPKLTPPRPYLMGPIRLCAGRPCRVFNDRLFSGHHAVTVNRPCKPPAPLPSRVLCHFSSVLRLPEWPRSI